MPIHNGLYLDAMLRDILTRMSNIEILLAEVAPPKGDPAEPVEIVLR